MHDGGKHWFRRARVFHWRQAQRDSSCRENRRVRIACSCKKSLHERILQGKIFFFGSYFPECVPSTLQPSLNESCWWWGAYSHRWVYRWAPENKQVARISASLAQGRANSEPPSLELARPWPKNARISASLGQGRANSRSGWGRISTSSGPRTR